jgi:hypothetical protein
MSPIWFGVFTELGKVSDVGGISRCVECGEVHWNLRLTARGDKPQVCRHCGAELKPEPRRFGRRLERLRPERRDPSIKGEGAPIDTRAPS